MVATILHMESAEIIFSKMDCANAEPATGSVPPPSSSRSTNFELPGSKLMEMIFNGKTK